MGFKALKLYKSVPRGLGKPKSTYGALREEVITRATTGHSVGAYDGKLPSLQPMPRDRHFPAFGSQEPRRVGGPRPKPT